MGQLVAPNSALINPQTQQPTFIGAPSQVLSIANQGLQRAGLTGPPNLGTDVMHPDLGPTTQAAQNLPQIGTPSFLQAARTGPGGMPNALSPGLSKGGKLLTILMSGLQGALAGQGAVERSVIMSGGHTRGGFGMGAEAGMQAPFQRAAQEQEIEKGQLQNQMLGAQAAYYPQMMFLNQQKTLSDIGKSRAEAGKAEAEASGQDYENELRKAQTNAARYKEIGGAMYDLQAPGGPKPVEGSAAAAFVPLGKEQAALAGVPEGTKVPIANAQKLTEMSNAGVHLTQANGRSIMVDAKGNTIRDLGAATPLVVANMGFSGAPGGGGNVTGGIYGSLPKEVQSIVDAVGTNRMNLQTAIQPYRRYPRMAQQIQAALTEQYPAYAQQNYQAIQDVVNKATSGAWADQKVAFNTAMQHADLLDKAALALQNGDTRALASLRNRFKTEFGSPDVTNFDAISHAYANEVQKMLSAGHLTDSELSQSAATIPSSANYKTIHQVLDSYRKLAQSKLDMVNQQIQQGMQGTGGLGGNQPPPGATVRDYTQVSPK